jgi:hypothetical protein
VSERDPNELGALWEKQGKKGTYFTGKIGDQPVVVFKNDRKQAGSKAPDWRVLKPQPEDREMDQRVPPPSGAAPDDDIEF